jgi:hypothetical protein
VPLPKVGDLMLYKDESVVHVKKGNLLLVTNVHTTKHDRDIEYTSVTFGNITFRIPTDIDYVLKKRKSSPGEKHYQNYKDIRHSYAMTAHTAQGSTYENVFLDLSDLSQCRDWKLKRRLLYVACSRASKHLYLTGEYKE